MDLEQILADLASKAREIEDKIEAIFAKAETAQRGVTAEELQQIEDFESQLDANKESQASTKKAIEARDRSAKRVNNRPTEPTARRTQPNSNGPVITNQREAFENDTQCGGFRSPREYMVAVQIACTTGTVDPRLERFKAAVGSDEHQTKNDPYGGFLIPPGFSPDLLMIDPEGDPMSGRTTMIPLSSTSVNIPCRVDKNHSTSVSGGLTVARRVETVAATASRMTLSQVKLETNSLFGLAYATEELLTDSPLSFAALLAAGFSDEFNSAIANERLNGTGVGQYLGIYNSPALLTISKEAGQSAATIVYKNVLKMRSRCYRYDRAVWLANHDTIPQLAQLNDSYNGVYWNSAEEDKPDMLLGRPIIYTEYVPTLGTVGDLTLCNWSEYLEGVYQPLQRAESIHVRFVEHERAFKYWIRNAGTPWWEAVLTPKNGATQSPYVVLETRS